MTTATQTMTGANNLANATKLAIDLSRKYEQAYLCHGILHTASKYTIFTHLPYLNNKAGETLVACYSVGELCVG